MIAASERRREHQAADTAPLPLPRHEGDARYQAALDADRSYGRFIVASLLMACFAGAAFGVFAARLDWPTTVLWAMTVAGFVVRCVSPRAAWGRDRVEPALMARVLQRTALLTTVCAVLCSLTGGRAGVWAVSVASLVSAVLWFLALAARWISRVSVLLLMMAGAGLGYFVIQPDTVLQTVVSCGAGTLTAIAVAISSRSAQGTVNFVMALSRLIALAWAVLDASRNGWPLLFLAVSAVLALDFHTIRRNHFAAVVAAVVFVHFGGLFQLRDAAIGDRWLLEIPALAIEYALLILAGFRHVQARVHRLSNATYRIAPLCIVPRLDRAWDYPVKINAS